MAAIDREHEPPDRLRAPLQDREGGSVAKIPESNESQVVATGESSAVGTDCQGDQVALVPVHRDDLTRRAAPEKITVMSVLQSASARQSDAVGADAGRARQHLGDEGLLSHPQCNGDVDCL